ncbi:TadE-like protein [Tsuneonella dongtanensis]|uniref:TadE-like protein n=1 Tax=Tsuneonella dongtanensis TaxID=692370 RepID=A0A1B2AF19_9SPHN|nr:TadE/TadG family type IV pilus assembly protein [Tsuneonella dongtanensis]ANY20688.1 TadE-like protein [Tsuneonella dongtanensis]
MNALRALWRDDRGATLVEFALISPALLMLLMGMFEMGYNYYVQAQLQGSVQKAARDSTIQSSQSSAALIDARVTDAVHAIVPGAELRFVRRAYSSFSDVHRAEDFTDIDKDGTCNDGEPFEDANGNGMWDEDRGVDGGGGARDAVLYVVEVRYPRAFGVAKLIGLSDNVETEAVTVLRNQPWDAQSFIGEVGHCA